MSVGDNFKHKRSVSAGASENRKKVVTPSQSAPATWRRPRRNVGDTVFVTSPTKIYLNYGEQVCGEQTKDVDETIIKDVEVDVPKIRSRLFEDSLESQEISFYIGDSDSDHLYESLYISHENEDDDYDSFDSDIESDTSFHKPNLGDSGLEMVDTQLPDPPSNQTYVLTRLAATMKRKFRRNWSLTKNDISKSLSRMTKRKSRTDLTTEKRKSNPEIVTTLHEPESKSLSRDSLFSKFRRSMSLSTEIANELTNNLETPKSKFYLTDEIDIDGTDSQRDSGASLSPVPRSSKVIRPSHPPPPVPVAPPSKEKRATSWYAEVGLFKSVELPKRPNTFWYAEVGLYPAKSTPSASSTENSGNARSKDLQESDSSISNYNSIHTDEDTANVNSNIPLRLESEPLYQFYDAAVVESVCHQTSLDYDSDGYEEVGDSEGTSSLRPSAMELVSSRNSIAIAKTLWCEIPEVINSTVLNMLSANQKKLQEAKFEMLTSEASYLNSLNVLYYHFIENIRNTDIIDKSEFDILFGKVEAVKSCSEKLIHDLEKCWQENILLYGICEVVQKHAEENFHVYVPYCENQIILDETLKRLKERRPFLELLRQLESSAECQSLTLYSFLMLPMQRITRLPLLVDAVLKRVPPQDSEHLTCQRTLATINKIVIQCNEAARRKERENEMRKIVNRLEFPKDAPQIDVVCENRWLVRSGSVIHMQQRNDETKLTFGKRFIKTTLDLFLFNDLFLVTKPKSDSNYTVVHYCPRNLLEVNSTDTLAALPTKDSQNRNLFFLTILENQIGKTMEFLISCDSDSDKERWIEALTSPKSEDPNETLYECWDCPQVTAVHNFIATQSDELAIAKGDVINVLRKMRDGWYHGERIRDGQIGWFPANYTMEIANPHVRAKNLKQRYRLLAFSENYLKTK